MILELRGDLLYLHIHNSIQVSHLEDIGNIHRGSQGQIVNADTWLSITGSIKDGQLEAKLVTLLKLRIVHKGRGKGLFSIEAGKSQITCIIKDELAIVEVILETRATSELGEAVIGGRPQKNLDCIFAELLHMGVKRKLCVHMALARRKLAQVI